MAPDELTHLDEDAVSVRFERADPGRIRITARVGTTSRTGVEMEALCAVSLAALSLWDMTKGVDKALAVSGIRVVRKEKAGP
jgi:cyclic pyranopterin phosphate synthase